MTTSPSEFSYIARLLPQYREQARKDQEWCREQIHFVMTQTIPRVGKRELMAWIEAIYEEAEEAYQDFLSMPDV